MGMGKAVLQNRIAFIRIFECGMWKMILQPKVYSDNELH